jgi:hypothetical protein
MAIRVPLVVDLNGPDGDNAAPESPEVRSPSRSNVRRRTTNATVKALVSMMGQRKQEMKALAYDATFQEFQRVRNLVNNLQRAYYVFLDAAPTCICMERQRVGAGFWGHLNAFFLANVQLRDGLVAALVAETVVLPKAGEFKLAFVVNTHR